MSAEVREAFVSLSDVFKRFSLIANSIQTNSGSLLSSTLASMLNISVGSEAREDTNSAIDTRRTH